jgi:hypothetical protein
MLCHVAIGRGGMLRWVGDLIGKWYQGEELAVCLSAYCSDGFMVFWGQEGTGAAWPRGRVRQGVGDPLHLRMSKSPSDSRACGRCGRLG